MNTFLSIFFKTSETFNCLIQQKRRRLNVKSSLVFIAFGILGALFSSLQQRERITNMSNGAASTLMVIFVVVLIVGFMFLLGYYVMPYVLYLLTRVLNGKSSLPENRVVVAYASLPSLVMLFMSFTVFLFNGEMELNHWFVRCLTFALAVLSYNIMIQGLMVFNKFNLLKAMLTISPLLIYTLYFWCQLLFS